MYNKKDSSRKCKPEKPSGGEGKMGKGKERSGSKKAALNKRNSTSLPPEKHSRSGSKHLSEKLEASSSFPRGTTICCRNEHRPGVSIKDVGLDIAGFLIEEEIRKNKEKLKTEIIRQIALSKELDKHLDRQRHIMNNYIRHNTIEETYRAQIMNNVPEKCNCMVCQEAAIEDASGCTCSGRTEFSEKSHVNRTKCVCFIERSPPIRNSYAQSTPRTRDMSCQSRGEIPHIRHSYAQSTTLSRDMSCHECNFQRNKSRDCKSAPSNCSTRQSTHTTNTELGECGIEGYIEDYSSIDNDATCNQIPQNTYSTSETTADRLQYSQAPAKKIFNETPANRLSTCQTPANICSTSESPVNNRLSTCESTANSMPISETPTNEMHISEIPANRLSCNEIPANRKSTNEIPATRFSTSEVPATRMSFGQTQTNRPSCVQTQTNETPANRLSFGQTQTPANRLSSFRSPTNRLSISQTPSNRLSTSQTLANRLSTSQTPANITPFNQAEYYDQFTQSEKLNHQPYTEIDPNTKPCKCVQSSQCTQADMYANNCLDEQKDATTEVTDHMLCNLNNILKTPLNTIQPQYALQQNRREDTTEVILSNIKNIIRDYMENINIKCTNCQSEQRAETNADEGKIVKVESKDMSSKQDIKSDISTKCENDGTHIDIVMEFCEFNKKKRAILEIEPCFDAQRCMKYNKKNYLKNRSYDEDDMNAASPCGSHSTCNSSRKFNPYRPRHRTHHRHSHSQRQRKGAGMSSHKRKSHIPSIMCKENASCHSSNDSVKYIRINKYNSKPSTVCQSSSSNSCEDRRFRPKRSNLKKQNKGKSTMCSYVSTLEAYPNEHSKHRRKKYSQTSIIRRSKHKKQDHRSSKKTEHRSHKTNKFLVSNPETETSRKHKEREKIAQLCSPDSSNLDETSYKKIVLYQKPKSPIRKKRKTRKTSNTCTTLSINEECSNIDISGKFYSKKDNETTLCSYPSDVLSSFFQISEQWSINGFEDKDETLASSNLLDDIHLDKAIKQRNVQTVKKSRNVIHEASASRNPIIDISPKQRHIKTGIIPNTNEVETDSSVDEIQPIEGLDAYPKISSDGGEIVLSPLFKSKRIQLIQKWLSYMHKLQGKEHFKTIAPAIVAIKLPTSSKYVLPNENSDEQVEYMLTPKSVFSAHISENTSNTLKESVFEKFKKTPESEKFNAKKLFGEHNKESAFEKFKKTPESEKSNAKKLFGEHNTKTQREKSNIIDKRATLKTGKNILLNEAIKKAIIKQVNKKGGIDIKKYKSEVLCTESSSSEYNIIGSSFSDSSFQSTSESLLDVNGNNHDELIQDLICPFRDSFKGKYFNVSETDRIINRAFYIQDIFVNLASTEEEKDYWRDTVLRAMKNIVTNTS